MLDCLALRTLGDSDTVQFSLKNIIWEIPGLLRM